MKLHVQSQEGVWYSATVVEVNAGRTAGPVKVHYLGYTEDSDEWVGTPRIRSRALLGLAPLGPVAARPAAAVGAAEEVAEEEEAAPPVPGAMTLAFDMYGTTFDLGGLSDTLKALPAVGEAKEPQFNSTWRFKQLEYTFRRTCMGRYEPMSNCTKQALDYCCEMFNVELTAEEKEKLCIAYQSLPAFPDCKEGLEALKSAGHRCYAFSNGTRPEVTNLIKNAGLEDCFKDIVVVDDMRKPTFRPDPKTYRYFQSCAKSNVGSTWLVSSNPFDIIGAATVGWKTAWLKRGQEAVFDPWPSTNGPTVVASDFVELAEAIKKRQ